MLSDKIDKKRLETLIDINQKINSNYTDIRSLLTHILDSSTRLTRGESSSLLLLDEESQVLYFEIALGIKAEEVSKYTVKVGEGIAGWVAKFNTSLIVNDVEQDPRFFSNIDKNVGYKTSSMLAVPLRIHSRCVGVIEVINKTGNRKFTEEDLEWLEIFSNQASLAYQNAKTFKKVRDELFELKDSVVGTQGYHQFIFNSVKTEDLLNTAKKYAKTNSTVFISGESGVGKELFAEQIHLNSLRSKEPFIRVNCAAIPEELLESELFGHTKGAFTDAKTKRLGRFKLADRGTIFLDEIGEIPLSVQSKLLRIIESGKFEPLGSSETIYCDVRIIAATNRTLQNMVNQKIFREDLFYRLNVLPLNIPPLRERKEDIQVLAEFFLNKYALKNRKEISGFSSKAISLLETFSWPGNIRQLENSIERAVIISKDTLINPEDFLLNKEKKDEREEYGAKSLKDAINLFKKNYIKGIMEETDYNQTKTARKLGIQRTYLSKLIKDMDIK